MRPIEVDDVIRLVGETEYYRVIDSQRYETLPCGCCQSPVIPEQVLISDLPKRWVPITQIEDIMGPATIGLTIPDKYYRAFQTLRTVSDNRTKSSSYIYDNFCTISDALTAWLWEQAPGSHKVIGMSGSQFRLQSTPDNPFGCYWTMTVLEKLSDQFRFGGLLEHAINDP